LWAFQWCHHLIKFFDIDGSKPPIPLGFLGRKRAVDFNDTTLETFKKIIPPSMYEIKSHLKEIVIEDKVKINYGGLDDQETINKFNSAEYAFLGIDQAEETERNDVSVLQASLRLRVNHKTPPYKELYTANPAECWLKQDFILSNRPEGLFIPALPDDNPYLPETYKETLRRSFAHDPYALKAYLEGDWDAFSQVEDAVFLPRWFELCRKAEPDYDEDLDVKIIAVDVATKRGDNETVIIKRIGNTIISIDCYKNIPTTKTAQLIKLANEEFKADTIVIDSDGFGCITEGTEIFTPDGWKCVETLAPGDGVYSKDDNGNLIRSSVKRNNKLEDIQIIDDGIRSFSFSHFIRCKSRKETPWRLRSWDDICSKEVHLDSSFKWDVKKQDFYLKSHTRKMPNGGIHETTESINIDGVRFAKFLGWYISEGCLCDNGGRFNEINIVQKNQHNEKDIEDVLIGCGFAFSSLTNKAGATRFRIFNKVLYSWLKKNCYAGGRSAPFKKAPEWIKDNSSDVIEGFLDRFMAGDGYVHKGVRAFYTSSKLLSDDLLELIYKSSKYGIKRKRFEKGSKGTIEGREITRQFDGYSIYEYRNNNICISNRKRKLKHYNGDVWELKVDSPTTLFMVRFSDNRAFWVFNEGVADVLDSQRIGVVEFHGGYATHAIDTQRYKNLRSQFHVMTARKVSKGFICLSKLDQGTYEKLKSQACQIKYKRPDPLCRYQIESKEDMRARQVMSPDLADALVYSEYGLWIGKVGETKEYAYR